MGINSPFGAAYASRTSEKSVPMARGNGALIMNIFAEGGHLSPNAFLWVRRSADTEFAALKSLGRLGRPSFSGSLQGRDVGQSGFECELALFRAAADAFSTYERGVADTDEPEETRQECFLVIHKGHRRRGGAESTAGRVGAPKSERFATETSLSLDVVAIIPQIPATSESTLHNVDTRVVDNYPAPAQSDWHIHTRRLIGRPASL
jgi:hypothetical protein